MSASFISKAQSWITPALLTNVMMERLGTSLRPCNQRQEILIERFPAYMDAIAEGIKPDEIASIWQLGGVDQVNTFLAQRGYDIKLEDPGERDGIAAAASIDLKLSWAKAGTPCVLPVHPDWRHASFTRNAIKGAHLGGAKVLTDGTIEAAHISIADRPLSCVLFACPKERLAGSQEDLGALSYTAMQVANPELQVFGSSSRRQGVRFPQINSDLKPNLDWLKGLGIGADGRITQALQQLKLSLDHKGMVVKEASAGYASRGLGPSPLDITGPMAVALVAHPEGRRPLVLLNGIFGPDCWVSA